MNPNPATPPRSIAVIANGAFSLVNFRGPLIREMVSRGLQVWALSPDFTDELRERVRALGAEPVDFSLDRTGLSPLRDIRDVYKLYRILRRLRPDATFSYFVKPVVYGSLAAAAAGVRRRYALVAGLGYVFAEVTPTKSWRRAALRFVTMQLYRAGFCACHRVFFQNDDDLAHFVDADVLPAEKGVRVAGTGVDLSHFTVAPVPKGPPRFLLVARLIREKGIPEFVAAAAQVKRQAPDVEFVVAGGYDPNPGGLTRHDIAIWENEGAVAFRGHVDDVRAEIARATVFVLPSNYREGMPRSTQEALAIGRAVITTDTIGCRETVIEGQNGFLVPAASVEKLTEAMMRFVRDPELARKMGAESRLLAERRFDVVAINRTILERMGISL